MVARGGAPSADLLDRIALLHSIPGAGRARRPDRAIADALPHVLPARLRSRSRISLRSLPFRNAGRVRGFDAPETALPQWIVLKQEAAFDVVDGSGIDTSSLRKGELFDAPSVQ